jgi:hypothetical protein
MGDLAEKIAEIIPAAYYDLISRIVAGGAIFYLWAILRLPGVELPARAPLSGAYALIVGIAMSYVLGIILTPIGYLVARGSSALLVKLAKLPQVGADGLWKQIDTLEQNKNRHEATILGKMAAEATLAENLVAGTAGLFLLSVLFAPTCNRHPLILGTILALCFLAAFFRRAVLVGRAKGLQYFQPLPAPDQSGRAQDNKTGTDHD